MLIYRYQLKQLTVIEDIEGTGRKAGLAWKCWVVGTPGSLVETADFLGEWITANVDSGGADGLGSIETGELHSESSSINCKNIWHVKRTLICSRIICFFLLCFFSCQCFISSNCFRSAWFLWTLCFVALFFFLGLIYSSCSLLSFILIVSDRLLFPFTFSSPKVAENNLKIRYTFWLLL